MLHERSEALLERAGSLLELFHPASIAVVGVSRDEDRIGSLWLKGLITAGFGGDLYAVGRSGGQLLGRRVYASLRDVPGPVDLVISCIPRESAFALLDECRARRAKCVYFYTAGFSESGDGAWAEAEKDLAARAAEAGIRVIGPNCFGIYCPEHGIPYGPFCLLTKPGSVGFISQSSGHMGKVLEFAMEHDIGFSRGVSIGNASELGAADFMECLALDGKTLLIGAYLEGCSDVRRLMESIALAVERKPVVVWKGGSSRAGARATASHTGSLASSSRLWTAGLRQAGAIEAHDLEELVDTLLLLDKVGRLETARPGVVCGVSDGGGGEAVQVCDLLARVGIEVPQLAPQADQKLVDHLGRVGSVLGNPVDLSQRQQDPGVLREVFETLVSEPYIDLLMLYLTPGMIFAAFPERAVKGIIDEVVRFHGAGRKPLLVILPPGPARERRHIVKQRLIREGLPVFPSASRAARALANVRKS